MIEESTHTTDKASAEADTPHAAAGAGFRYRGFISYSHKDRKFTRWLIRRLEAYRVPKRLVGRDSPMGLIPKTLAPIFRDRDELASASDLGERLNTVLRDSAALIVVCSPAAANSRWVSEEILAFKRIHGPERVFCVIVDGDPQSGDASQQCLPRPLRYRIGPDGELSDVPIEPMAADARPEGDGRRRAVLKLIAGLLGVGYDELHRRELARRQRRMTAITAGALAGMALASTLATVAYIARDDAERRREQAEDLLGFLVDDLQDRLSPLGRLDVLETVLDKTMGYFHELDPRDLTDTALARQAQAMVRIGEIRIAQGRSTEAIKSFRDAFASSAALAERDPTNGQRLFDRGQAEFWIGFVYWREKELDNTEEWFSRYRDTSLELVALDPSNDEWINETVYAYHNLAVLESERNNLTIADEMFEAESVILDGMLQSDPDNAELRFGLSDTIAWRGNIATTRGDLAAAEDFRREALRLLTQLVEQHPGNKTYAFERSRASVFVANLLMVTGRIPEAERMLKQARSASQALVKHDPENSLWLANLALVEIDLARIALISGRMSQARSIGDQGLLRLQQLSSSEASDVLLARRLAEGYQANSQIRLASGDTDEARELVDNAAAVAEDISTQEPSNSGIRGRLAQVLVTRGQILDAVGDRASALADWQAVVGLLNETVPGSNDYDLLDPWVRAHLLLDDNAAAQDALDRLEISGYQPLEPWPTP